MRMPRHPKHWPLPAGLCKDKAIICDTSTLAALECPVYSDLRALRGSLLTGLPPDSDLATRVLFTPCHFWPLAFFLRAVCARRVEYVAHTGPTAISPSWGLHPAGVLSGLWAFPVGVGVLVAGLLLAACLLAVAAFLSL